jgi:hypothetical protein
MARVLQILIVSVAVASLLGCAPEVQEELGDCQDQLEDCLDKTSAIKSGDETPAGFTLVLEKDGLGTFQPFSNQFRGQSGREFRDGFFLQIGDYFQALHAYDAIELLDDNGATVKDYQRGEAQWIDVECGRTDQHPITVEMAKLLVPVKADSATHDYRLHGLLDLNGPVTAVTMWAPDSGLRLKTMKQSFGSIDQHPAHGHVEFHFTSSEPCEVRVWTSMQASATAEIHSTADSPRVTKLVVREYSPPANHGGLHQPSWPNLGP